VTYATNNVNDILISRGISNERYVTHSIGRSFLKSHVYMEKISPKSITPAFVYRRYKAIHLGKRINTAMVNKEVSLEVHCL
jgi:hypothetical protein